MTVLRLQDIKRTKKIQPMVLRSIQFLIVQHMQLSREDNKKFFYRSVSIKEGNVFSIFEKMTDCIMNNPNREEDKEEKHELCVMPKKPK